MNRSTNYNLYLPESSDYRDVSQLTWNFSTIDTALGSLVPATDPASAPADLDSATATGNYFCDGDTANKPVSGVNGICQVVSTVNPTSTTNGYIYQIFRATTGKVYLRHKINNGSWSSWNTMLSRQTNAVSLSEHWIHGTYTAAFNRILIPACNISSYTITKIEVYKSGWSECTSLSFSNQGGMFQFISGVPASGVSLDDGKAYLCRITGSFTAG